MIFQLKGTLTGYEIKKLELRRLIEIKVEEEGWMKRRLQDGLYNGRSNNSQIAKMMKQRRRSPFYTHNQW